MLGQIGKLDGTKQGGMTPHQKHAQKQQRRRMPDKARRDDQHKHDFKILDPARQQRLVVFVGQLTRGSREQHKRQNEQAANNWPRQLRVHAAPFGRVISRQHGKSEFENIIVACAQKLRPEKWREATLR